jgi:SAM-dependent methyltransferase
MTEPTHWWDSFFDARYARACLDHVDPATTRATVDFLTRALGLVPGSTVLDQCCGTGRLSVPLARRGIRVVGVDLSPDYVRRAEASARGVPGVSHVVGDAASFVRHPPVDAVVNWFTSFGYADEALDRAFFARAAESLRPGGAIALDTFNLPLVLSSLGESDAFTRVRRAIGRRLEIGAVDRYPHEQRHGGVALRDTRVDWSAGVLTHRWTIDGETRVSRSRMIMPHELVRLVREVGFESPVLYGSSRGEPFGPTSPRCILVARRRR